jgi:hypothetical protein
MMTRKKSIIRLTEFMVMLNFSCLVIFVKIRKTEITFSTGYSFICLFNSILKNERMEE